MLFKVTKSLKKYNLKYLKLKTCFTNQASIIFKNTNLFTRASQIKTNNLYTFIIHSDRKSRLFLSYLISKNLVKNMKNTKIIKVSLKKSLLNYYKLFKNLLLIKRFIFLKLFKSALNSFNLYKYKSLKIFKLYLIYKKFKFLNLKKREKLTVYESKVNLSLSKLYYRKRAFKKNFVKKRLSKNLQTFDKLGEDILNTLKTKLKFQQKFSDPLKYSKVFFKYTGSNIFATITSKEGEVLHSYSSGFFKGLRTRKEKTTIFISKQLGELISIRLYKLNAKEVFFIPFINHRKSRTLMKYMVRGFRLVKTFKFVNLFIKINVMRNGVRLRKAPRK